MSDEYCKTGILKLTNKKSFRLKINRSVCELKRFLTICHSTLGKIYLLGKRRMAGTFNNRVPVSAQKASMMLIVMFKKGTQQGHFWVFMLSGNFGLLYACFFIFLHIDALVFEVFTFLDESRDKKKGFLMSFFVVSQLIVYNDE